MLQCASSCKREWLLGSNYTHLYIYIHIYIYTYIYIYVCRYFCTPKKNIGGRVVSNCKVPFKSQWHHDPSHNDLISRTIGLTMAITRQHLCRCRCRRRRQQQQQQQQLQQLVVYINSVKALRRHSETTLPCLTMRNMKYSNRMKPWLSSCKQL